MNARQRKAMCTGKVRYRSKGDAIAAAERHFRRFKVRHRTYRCPCCNGFHNTTKEKW